MPDRFYPSRVDYEGAMAREFNAARAVSNHGAAVWRSAFEPYSMEPLGFWMSVRALVVSLY
jgi:hypothetical protein